MQRHINKKRTVDAVTVALMSAVIALCSWITFPIGAVPVTLQTFAVAACVSLLGMKKGTIAVIVYILLGIVGLPVFSFFTGGIGALTGATGGYISGFVFMAIVGGFFCDKFRNSIAVNIAGMLAGLVLCYITGTLWYVFVWLKSPDSVSVAAVFASCVLPYIIPDIIKISLACWVAKAVRARIGVLK